MAMAAMVTSASVDMQMNPVPSEIFIGDEVWLGWTTTPADVSFTTLTLHLRQSGEAVMTLGEDHHTNARHFTWYADGVSGNQYDIQVVGMLANGTMATAATNVFIISDPASQLWYLFVLLIIPCTALYVCCKHRVRQRSPAPNAGLPVATPYYGGGGGGGESAYYPCPAATTTPPPQRHQHPIDT